MMATNQQNIRTGGHSAGGPKSELYLRSDWDCSGHFGCLVVCSQARGWRMEEVQIHYCDVHRAPMAPAAWEIPSAAMRCSGFACSEHGCKRRYSATLDYFDQEYDG